MRHWWRNGKNRVAFLRCSQCVFFVLRQPWVESHTSREESCKEEQDRDRCVKAGSVSGVLGADEHEGGCPCVVRCFAEWRCANVCAVGHPLPLSVCLSFVGARAMRLVSDQERCELAPAANKAPSIPRVPARHFGKTATRNTSFFLHCNISTT